MGEARRARSWLRPWLLPAVLVVAAGLQLLWDLVANLLSGQVPSDLVTANRGLFLALALLLAAICMALALATHRLTGRPEASTAAELRTSRSPRSTNAGGGPGNAPPTAVRSTDHREAGLHNLPARNQHFAGRAELLAWLDRQFTSRWITARIVALFGLGGIGKTQIAIEYAHRHRPIYRVRWIISARSSVTTRAGLKELARRIGLDPGIQPDRLVPALYRELDRLGHWLLVFDDAKEPAALRPYLPTGGWGDVIITSRNPHWSDLAAAVRIPDLPAQEASEFLLTRTRSDDRAAAEELAGVLGGLPLALAQAAAYVAEKPGVTLRGYLDRYRRAHRRLLRYGRPLDYPHPVATTWQLNLQELARRNPAAVQLLRLMAFWGSDATVPLDLLLRADPDRLPRKLGAAVRDLLSLDVETGALYRYSLISSDQDGFRVHRLVQTITRDRLNGTQKRQWAERAVQVVLGAFPDAPAEPRHWPWIARLLPHALAVSHHSEQAAPELAGKLLDAVGIYLGSRDGTTDELREARACLLRALLLIERGGTPNDPEVARVLRHLGAVLCQLGEIREAREALERAVRILDDADERDDLQLSATLNNLGNVLRHQGDLLGARWVLERAVRVSTQIRPDGTEGTFEFVSLGNVLLELGELREARAVVECALRVEEAIYRPDHLEIARTLCVLSAILHRQGEVGGARRSLERALQIFENTYGPRHPRVARTSYSLAVMLIRHGELPAGLRQLRRGA